MTRPISSTTSGPCWAARRGSTRPRLVVDMGRRVGQGEVQGIVMAGTHRVAPLDGHEMGAPTAGHVAPGSNAPLPAAIGLDGPVALADDVAAIHAAGTGRRGRGDQPAHR